VARVVVTPGAVEDLNSLVAALGMSESALARVQRSLRILERFPKAGRALSGPWEGARFLVGPWPWMILAYIHDEPDDAVFVVSVQDARSGPSPW
jgi:plasmid stabilization system protein ParE